MPGTNTRIIISDDLIHIQEFDRQTNLLISDIPVKPDHFEGFFEVRAGSPVLIELPWEHFFGVLRVLAERIAQWKGFTLPGRVNGNSII